MTDIQKRIDAAPKEHEPRNYVVRVNEFRTGKFLYERYVRASSETRARLTALKTEREVFGKKKTTIGAARIMSGADFL